MTPLPPDYRKIGSVHRIGLAADRPAASDVLVGTLYCSTDTATLERSNGTTWESYAGSGATGPPGPTGPTGPTGATGATGPGVATGGATGNPLVKQSGTDYDTVWASSVVVDNANVRMGIGVTPTYGLHIQKSAEAATVSVVGDGQTSSVRMVRHSADATGPVMTFTKARGSVASPAVVNGSDKSLLLQAYAQDSVSTNTLIGSIEIGVSANGGSDNVSSYMSLTTRPIGAAAVPIERLRISSEGNIGIGETNAGINRLTVYNASAACNILIKSGAAQNCGIRFLNTMIEWYVINNPSGQLDFYDATNLVTRGRWQTSGAWNVANLAGTGNRAVYSTSIGDLTNTSSDARLKENIETIENPLEILEGLRGVYHEWIDKVKYGEGRQVGVLAQEVQKVLPELVGTNADGTLSVDYDKFAAVLIEGHRKLKQRLDSIEARLANLEK